MDPKRPNIPKIEFQSTEERTKKIVAIMRMLSTINYSELRILPDNEINILFKILIDERNLEVRLRNRSYRPFGDTDEYGDIDVIDETEDYVGDVLDERPSNNYWRMADESSMPF